MDRFLIDTDILSYYFKGDPDVVRKFNQYLDQSDVIEISLVTYYEITSGLLAKNALLSRLQTLLYISAIKLLAAMALNTSSPKV